jgi:hypothetical protein
MDENGAAYRYALSQCAAPYVPFLGLHSKDLIFFKDGNADTNQR